MKSLEIWYKHLVMNISVRTCNCNLNKNAGTNHFYAGKALYSTLLAKRSSQGAPPSFLRHPPLDSACPHFKIFVSPLLTYLRQFPLPSRNPVFP